MTCSLSSSESREDVQEEGVSVDLVVQCYCQLENTCWEWIRNQCNQVGSLYDNVGMICLLLLSRLRKTLFNPLLFTPTFVCAVVQQVKRILVGNIMSLEVY